MSMSTVAISSTTKEKILDVAQDLIQRRGLNAMSFQDLSDAIGIRKASIHHHFPSKTEMVNALLLRYQNDFAKAVQQILESRKPAKNKLTLYFNLFRKTLEAGRHDKTCLCGVLIAELYSLDPHGAALVRSFLNTNTASICRILNAGIADRSLSIRGDVETTAELILATLEGGLLLARCDGGPKRFAEMLTQLTTLLA